MMLDAMPRALALKICLLACLLAYLLGPDLAAAQAAQARARQEAPRAARAPRPPAKPPAAADGYQLTPAPGWVADVAADESAALPAAPVHVLLLDRQIRVERSGSVRYTRVVRKVNDAAGLQQGAQIEIEFDPSYQALQLHRVGIWREGRLIDKLDRKLVKLLHRETQLERQLIDGRVTASIVLDDLRVGDRVEWAYSLVGDNPVFAGRFADLVWLISSSGPVALAQVRLVAPQERGIRHRVAERDVEISQVVEGAWRVSTFRRKLVPQYRFDPLLPPIDAHRDQLELSEFDSWAEVAAWSSQLFDRAMQPTPAVDALAREIEAKGSTPGERMKLALDFVQQEIRYFGTESGINSHQPAATDVVLRQRFGDCKDKAALLSALLRRLGFDAVPALVSASFREHASERLVSPLVFDHAIVAVAQAGQTLWLDATRSLQTGAAQTRQASGFGHALLARADVRELSALPPPAQELRAETTDTFRFDQLAKEGRLESVTLYHGELADGLRAARAGLPPADFQKALLDETLRFYPSLVPDGQARVEDLADRNTVRIVQSYRTGDFWRSNDLRMLAGNLAFPSLIARLRLPDQTPRTSALRLAMPGRYLHHVRYEFGEDVFGQDGSQRFDESNEHFLLQLRYQGTRKAQQVDGELTLLRDTIAAGQWNRYREQLGKVAPRLSAYLQVPVLSPEQLAQLRKEFGALQEQIRRETIKVSTQEQAAARARLLGTDKVLAADRLPPKLRAQALKERAVQLDHLGNPAAGDAALREALALDPESAEIHAAQAVNALLRRADDEAIRSADKTLQLAPNDVSVRYTRAFALYFAGKYQEALSELRQILGSRNEVERSYAPIWLYLSSRRSGEDGVASLKSALPTGSNPPWPYPVLQWLAGQADFSAAYAATRDNGRPIPGRECELYFYAAQKVLLDGDIGRARFYLQKSLDTGVVEFNEYAMAQRELERIGAR